MQIANTTTQANAQVTVQVTAMVTALARTLRAQMIETHISWVLLAKDTAYKIKKPVRLPFLDYAKLQPASARVSSGGLLWPCVRQRTDPGKEQVDIRSFTSPRQAMYGGYCMTTYRLPRDVFTRPERACHVPI